MIRILRGKKFFEKKVQIVTVLTSPLVFIH